MTSKFAELKNKNYEIYLSDNKYYNEELAKREKISMSCQTKSETDLTDILVRKKLSPCLKKTEGDFILINQIKLFF